MFKILKLNAMEQTLNIEVGVPHFCKNQEYIKKFFEWQKFFKTCFESTTKSWKKFSENFLKILLRTFNVGNQILVTATSKFVIVDISS